MEALQGSNLHGINTSSDSESGGGSVSEDGLRIEVAISGDGLDDSEGDASSAEESLRPGVTLGQHDEQAF